MKVFQIFNLPAAGASSASSAVRVSGIVPPILILQLEGLAIANGKKLTVTWQDSEDSTVWDSLLSWDMTGGASPLANYATEPMFLRNIRTFLRVNLSLEAAGGTLTAGRAILNADW